MPKIAQKTPNFAIFHLFWVYFFPQTGPRPVSPPPAARILKYMAHRKVNSPKHLKDGEIFF